MIPERRVKGPQDLPKIWTRVDCPLALPLLRQELKN